MSNYGNINIHERRFSHGIKKAENLIDARNQFEINRNQQKSSEIIRNHQKSSEIIRNHQKSSEITRNHRNH
jgi:hypothetical protein